MNDLHLPIAGNPAIAPSLPISETLPSEPMPDTSVPVATPELAAKPVDATQDAKRIAQAILEVLGGVRSVSDTAVNLGITTNRYYTLESRALAGLIAACEPNQHSPGRTASLSADLERLRTERDRLKEEIARYQALTRIAQATFSKSSSSPVENAVTSAQRKKRTASVRAMQFARKVSGEKPARASTAGTTNSTNGVRMTRTDSDQAGG